MVAQPFNNQGDGILRDFGFLAPGPETLREKLRECLARQLQPALAIHLLIFTHPTKDSLVKTQPQGALGRRGAGRHASKKEKGPEMTIDALLRWWKGWAMPHKLRVEYGGAIFHVLNRGGGAIPFARPTGLLFKMYRRETPGFSSDQPEEHL
jgi:hypothetical protein